MSEDKEKIEFVSKFNKKGVALPRYHVVSWGNTLEMTNSEQNANKAYDKSSSRNKKLYRIDTEGLQTLVKSNYTF